MKNIYLLFLLTFSSLVYADNESLSLVLENVIPAVVNIRTEGQLPPVIYVDANKNQTNELGSKPFTALGSGVIVDEKNGYIVTNAHVIKDADRIIVTLSDGRHFPAKEIGVDEPSDLAVIQIPANKLDDIELGDSSKIAVGDSVIAIGNPFGLSQSVTSGIISALERTDLQIDGYEDFIQIDAPINPGNSGGALINPQGELIGINSAILTNDGGNLGIGFAIPVNMVSNVTEQLIRYGKVERGIMGVSVQTILPTMAETLKLSKTKGAIVTSVLPNSPADKAGIQVGDVITRINNENIHSASQVVNTVGFLRTDTKVDISALRNGKTIHFAPTIIAVEKQKQLDQEKNPFLYGVALQDFNQYNQQGNVLGALVLAVSPESNAWSSDIRPGDVILEADHQPIKDTLSLESIVNKTQGDLLLRIMREGNAAYLVIPQLTNVNHD